jgi:DNA-binding beta-propeller fold protein YncE
MKFNRSIIVRAVVLISLIASLTVLSSRLHADTGDCGGVTVTLPFTDVMGNAFFCQIAAAYFSGLTNGTTATTFSPTQNVTREQMAAFTTRTMDQALKRGSHRAALDQYWTTQGENNLALTTIGLGPLLVKSDGADLWAAHIASSTVSRVRASDGKLLETWTDAPFGHGVLCAMGKVFVTGDATPGRLYQIDPTQPAGAVTTLSSALGIGSSGITYDGQRIWTANNGTGPGSGSVSIVTLNPLTVTNVTTGFNRPVGILYDGANIWVTDQGDGMLKKLDTNGAILQAVPVGLSPRYPAFDGSNLWVPNANSSTVTVVRATGVLSGTVLATLSGNGLNGPITAAFDGERILVTNVVGESISLWNASDLTPLVTFSTGADTRPWGVCSDGLNFWITFNTGPGKLARF